MLEATHSPGETEIIRQAIEREAAGVSRQPIARDRAAWQELVTFLEMRQKAVAGGRPYQWNREEIYAEPKSGPLPA